MKNKSSKITNLVECNVQHSMYIEEKSKDDIEQTQVLNEYKKALDQSTIVFMSDKNDVITYVNDTFVIIG